MLRETVSELCRKLDPRHHRSLIVSLNYGSDEDADRTVIVPENQLTRVTLGTWWHLPESVHHDRSRGRACMT